MIDIRAYAKINLFLNVLGKRPDGYHEIETVFQSIDLHDKISIRKISSGIKIDCAHPDVPSDQRNLACRAAGRLIEKSKIDQGVELVITKQIPVGAGLGGGSADAAATLVGMNHLFGLGYSQSELMRLGAKLGADVPFCIMGGTALGRGIGEILTPLPPLKEAWIVLANPGIKISTAWAYKSLNLMLTKSEKNVNIFAKVIENYAPESDDLEVISKHLFNIFESIIEAKYPAVANLKKRLKSDGTLAILMTGSGSTVYALMKDRASAVRLVDSLTSKIGFCRLVKTTDLGIKFN